MTGPNLTDDALDELEAFTTDPTSLEARFVTGLLAPLQRMSDIVLDDEGAFASVFARTIPNPVSLRWAAQWAGVDPDNATTDQLRDDTYLRQQWKRGSNEAILSAIQSVLTGAKHVRFYERRDPANFTIDAGPYHLAIVTTTSQTPGGTESIIKALRPVLPARIRVHIAVVDGLSWQDLVDSDRTWQDVLSDFEDWQHVYEGDAS